MKGRIVLYGVRQVALRRDIELFLDEEYEIIACSDGHYTHDPIDNKPFVKPAELRNVAFEYVILLSYHDSTLEEMRRDLISFGIPEEKIVKPTFFVYNSAAKDQINLVADFEYNYKGEMGLLFGACYTLRDIAKDELLIPFYDCGWHSLDLYYNYRLLSYAAERGLLSDVKRALFIFSYYCFNYDMSHALPQYQRGQMFSVWQFDDWHHYDKVPGARDYVLSFKLFGKKTFEFYNVRRFDYCNPHIYNGANGAARLNSTWFNRYDATIEEYTDVFMKFVSTFERHQIELSLVVPPYYLDGVDAASLEAFGRMKRLYYEVVKKTCEGTGIKVYDYAGLYAAKKEYFSDIIHLNSVGAREFTQQINRDILSN